MRYWETQKIKYFILNKKSDPVPDLMTNIRGAVRCSMNHSTSLLTADRENTINNITGKPPSLKKTLQLWNTEFAPNWFALLYTVSKWYEEAEHRVEGWNHHEVGPTTVALTISQSQSHLDCLRPARHK